MRFDQPTIDVMVSAAQRPEVTELVEHVDLVGGFEKVLVIVLAVHVDEGFTDLLQHAERDGVTVKAHGASPRRVEFAGEKNLPAVLRDGDVGDAFDLL